MINRDYYRTTFTYAFRRLSRSMTKFKVTILNKLRKNKRL